MPITDSRYLINWILRHTALDRLGEEIQFIKLIARPICKYWLLMKMPWVEMQSPFDIHQTLELFQQIVYVLSEKKASETKKKHELIYRMSF